MLDNLSPQADIQIYTPILLFFVCPWLPACVRMTVFLDFASLMQTQFRRVENHPRRLASSSITMATRP